MGADLIAYILVGPTKLLPSDALKQSITIEASHLCAVAQEAQTAVGEQLSPEKEQLLQDLDSYEIDYLASLDPQGALRDFLKLWNEGGYRDCETRCVERPGVPTERILVAGDMSWGDEPDGAAYQAIKAALALGITDALGVH